MSINRGMNKDYKCTVECYSAIKKNKTMPFAATWMDLEMIVLREGRERQTPYYPIYM